MKSGGRGGNVWDREMGRYNKKEMEKPWRWDRKEMGKRWERERRAYVLDVDGGVVGAVVMVEVVPIEEIVLD